MANLRLFFSIPCAPSTIKSISILTKKIKKEIRHLHARWIPEKNYHLTLRFVGSVPEENLSLLIKSTENILKQKNAFNINITRLICLPNSQAARVLAVGVTLNTELADLFQALEQALVKAGFPPETRPFLPHVTIAKLVRPASLNGIINDFKITLEQRADRVDLLRSDTTPEGSVYHCLKYWKFLDW